MLVVCAIGRDPILHCDMTDLVRQSATALASRGLAWFNYCPIGKGPDMQLK